MTILKGLVLALALTLWATGARADACNVMRQSLAEDQIWQCTIAYWSGTTSRSSVECFASSDEGFAWVGSRLARADRIITGICRNKGANLRYRDWSNRDRADR